MSAHGVRGQAHSSKCGAFLYTTGRLGPLGPYPLSLSNSPPIVVTAKKHASHNFPWGVSPASTEGP